MIVCLAMSLGAGGLGGESAELGHPPPHVADELAQLTTLTPGILTVEERRQAAGMIDRDIRRRTAEVNARHRAEWSRVQSREQWEAYRDTRIERLRQSLAEWPAPPAELPIRVTGTLDGDGYRIENLIYESRPAQWVPGNLYVPASPGRSLPGILLAHSHHRDKTHSELQDMGMTWARAGCLVLVIDQVGYGERRAHPFSRDSDYARPYRTTRQDYYFRYDSGVQLQLLGDSLMGWMVWDLMRGVDVLLAREGIDPQRIILLGAVAGGGDPAGVTAALDPRIACCVPFNFGGPQPESAYPLPQDAETTFDLLGGTYWDSTRGLRLGGRDDFLHWVIVASTAPRHLIHAHEFSWDAERDPVWKRYQRVWGQFYGSADRLGFAHGYGTLRQPASQASHCTHIGRVHRRMIHPLLEQWFGIRVREADEYSAPRPAEDLVCLTEPVHRELRPASLTEVMSEMAETRVAAARAHQAAAGAAQRRAVARQAWNRLLGSVAPAAAPHVLRSTTDDPVVAGASVERVLLEVEDGILVPVLVLVPDSLAGQAPLGSKPPGAVVGLAHGGKAEFLRRRGSELLELLQQGTIVVLPDVRGTGETRAGSGRGRESGDTNRSVHVQLFGDTLLGQRLRDVRSVLMYLRQRPDVDPQRIALWGDSFTEPNPPQTDFQVPHGVDGWPQHPEPLGGQLALLTALFDESIRAVYVAGGLSSIRGVLSHYAVLVPHDSCVPGAITAGDLCDLAASLAPLPLCLESLADHLNRSVPAADLFREYRAALDAYAATSDALRLSEHRTSAAAWLLEQVATAGTP